MAAPFGPPPSSATTRYCTSCSGGTPSSHWLCSPASRACGGELSQVSFSKLYCNQTASAAASWDQETAISVLTSS